MKVLITAPFSSLGGVATFVNNIALCWDNDVIIFRRGKKDNCSIVANLFLTFLLPFRFLFFLILKSPDRVVVNTSLSLSLLFRDGILVILSKLLAKKTLLVIHGFNETALAYKRILRCGFFIADAICVLADEFKQQIITAGYNRKVYVQQNPVSSDILKLEQSTLPPVSRMIFIGRIEKKKGIYITIEAFHILKKNHSEMTLDVVGTGSEYENVLEYIRDNEIEGVTLYGFKAGKEKNEVLKKGGLTIFPSYHKEGLPISVLEAMTVGQLIISRPVGGIVDLYKQCDFGKIVSSLEAKDFAMAYEELITDPIRVENIRRNNREFALKHFTPKAIVENIERIFGEMN